MGRPGEPDCLECKIIGASGAFMFGSIAAYNSFCSPKCITSRPYRWFLRSLALGAYYIAVGRVFYFPPFSHLKENSLQNLVEKSKQPVMTFFDGPSSFRRSNEKMGQIINLVDPQYELVDPTPNIHELFVLFTDQLFFGELGACTVEWSSRMTSCAGICSYHPKSGMCTIRLSEPLLKLRPRKDLIETLLHEMIHAYLFVTQRVQDRDGHGPNFQAHMHRINSATGTNITIFHSFHAEVALYKQHWWRCQGACRDRGPYYGWVKRAMNRAPGPSDFWWAQHTATCGGMFVKVKEPENEKKTKKPIKEKKSTVISAKDRNWLESLPNMNLTGMTLGEALSKELGTKPPKHLGNSGNSTEKRKKVKDENSLSSSASKQPKINSLFPGKGYTLGGTNSEIKSTRAPLEVIRVTPKVDNQLSAIVKDEIIFLDDMPTPKPKTAAFTEVICLD